MKKILLKALKRDKNGKKTRQDGFMPGIIYGKNITPITVKFEENNLINLLKEKGERAAITIELNGEERLGIIKELGRDNGTAEILHIDIQLINETQKIKRTLPVEYIGKKALKSLGLYLQVYIPNVDVYGQANLIPENIKVNVSNRPLGTKITINDLNLNENLKPLQSLTTTLSAISRL